MMATPAEAHREWHRNTGIPIGTPGCPQDACHVDDEWWVDPPAPYWVVDGERFHDFRNACTFAAWVARMRGRTVPVEVVR